MLNMLRMDLRRMFRVKMMFIAFLCLAAGILISIITLRTVTDPELRQQAIESGVEITTSDETDFESIRSLTETQALCTTIYSGSFIFVALYIVVVLFVCNDYSSGFAKNIFSFYGGRWCYYVSKLLCMTIVCALWILGSFLIFRICSVVSGMNFARSNLVDYLRVFVEYKTLYGSVQAVTANVTYGSPVGEAMAVTAVWLAVWSALSLLALYKKDI